MSNRFTPMKSKLYQLREWLTIPETAKYLSIMLNEEVGDADILRLGLDGHLKLSVDLVNGTAANIGRIVSEDEVEYAAMPQLPREKDKDTSKQVRVKEASIHLAKSFDNAREKYKEKHPDWNGTPQLVFFPVDLKIDENRWLKLEKEVKSIKGVWDLPMIGGELLDIEHEYQMLTGGPEVTLETFEGAVVERGSDVMCRLMESYEYNEYQSGSIAQLEQIKNYITENNIELEKANELLENHKKERKEYLKKRERNYSFDYYPAGGLPHDSVLIIRMKSLITFIERISQPDSEKNKPLDGRSEKTYLNIIGAMLETFIHNSHGEMKFDSEAKSREFFSHKYAGFRGLTKRTLAEKFSAAKKAIREELD